MYICILPQYTYFVDDSDDHDNDDDYDDDDNDDDNDDDGDDDNDPMTILAAGLPPHVDNRE